MKHLVLLSLFLSFILVLGRSPSKNLKSRRSSPKSNRIVNPFEKVTNADRFKRGLPPVAPRKLYTPSKVETAQRSRRSAIDALYSCIPGSYGYCVDDSGLVLQVAHPSGTSFNCPPDLGTDVSYRNAVCLNSPVAPVSVAPNDGTRLYAYTCVGYAFYGCAYQEFSGNIAFINANTAQSFSCPSANYPTATYPICLTNGQLVRQSPHSDEYECPSDAHPVPSCCSRSGGFCAAVQGGNLPLHSQFSCPGGTNDNYIPKCLVPEAQGDSFPVAYQSDIVPANPVVNGV